MREGAASQPLPLQTPQLDWLDGPAAALLHDMLDGYNTYRFSRRLDETTVTAANAVLLDFLQHARGIPGQVTPEDFERWSTALFLERGVAAGTQRKYQATVRAAFNYWLEQPRYRNRVRSELGYDIIQVATPENCIIHRLQHERAQDHCRRAFSGEELDQLFDTYDREIAFAYRMRSKSLYALQRDKTLFATSFKFGLRPNEARQLNMDSFQPNPRFPELGRYALAHVFGKGGKWRTVTALDATAPKMLEWYVAEVRPRYLDNACPEEMALFLSEQGRRLSYAALHRQFGYIRDLAGLPFYLPPHCLRHSSVTENDLNGLSLEANRQQHGHVYAATTQGYMHHPDAFVAEEFSRIIRKTVQQTPDLNRKR